MKKKIYLHLLLVGVVCILLTALVCAFAYWQTSKQETGYYLEQTASVLGSELTRQENPLEFLDHTSKASPDLRITWVAEDGRVLYDSMKNASDMDNHKERPEILRALLKGRGTDARESSTLGQLNLYSALRLTDGSVLRVAWTQKDLFRPLALLLPWWLLALGVLMLICLFTVRHFTKDLIKPLDQATLYLSRIGNSQEQLPDTLFQNSYDELKPFLNTIRQQGAQLDQSMRQLQEERNTMRLITDNLTEGVFLLDDQLRIQWVNAWGSRLLLAGNPSATAGREQLTDKFLMALLPQDARIKPEILQDGEPHTWLMKHQAHQYRLLLRPLETPRERASQLLIIRDITEAREREQLRRDFTANVTHELKTPLTSISGFAELMAAGMYQKKEDIAHFGQLIRQEAKRLLEMINSIIFLSRIEEVPAGTLKEAVPLGDLIRTVVDFMDPFCKEKQVTVHCQLTQDKVRGSGSLLREMAMNLIDNGVKYNRPGGHVYVSMKRDGAWVQLTVRDTGIGIPDAVQERVFERFYRVEESRSKQSGGSGLGLSIVKHIVEQHQGQISLVSRLNEGTTITVRLPAEGPQEETQNA